MNPKAILFIASLAVLTIISGCSYRRQPTPQEAAYRPTTLASTTNMGTTLLLAPDTAPRQGPPNSFEFIMPEDQQRQILREAPKLNRGDNVDEVIRRLGPPNHDELMYPKTDDPPKHRYLEWNFAKVKMDGNGGSDPCIELFFDMDGHLDSLVSNVPVIPDINWSSEIRPYTTWSPRIASAAATRP